MLISPRILLEDAAKNNYAIGAFNFYNLDTLTAILKAAEKEQSPVIVQIYSSHFLHYNNGTVIAAAALDAVRRSSVPAALHLDHSTTYECILRAIQCGFNSVMFDGSALNIKENIALTSKVREVTKTLDIFSEAELGKIYRIGLSDDHNEFEYTTIEDAILFVNNTKIDSLAPAVGTAHGMYEKEPDINFERIADIAKAVKLPLVLHGGSGIPDKMIVKCIDCGIRKINVGTELKYTWGKETMDRLQAGEKEPITLSGYAIKAVEEIVCRKIRLFGSCNRAAGIFHILSGKAVNKIS
jgi:ketose-bisphosphate aldolase